MQGERKVGDGGVRWRTGRDGGGGVVGKSEGGEED